MNIAQIQAFINGHTVAPEPWQWLYLGIIGLAGMLLCLPIAKSLRPHTPFWLTALAALAILVWFTPHGLIGVFALHVMLLASLAPIGASVIAAAFCIGAFWLTMMEMFPWTWIGKRRPT